MVISALVREVCLHAFHGAVRFFALDPHQRPCTGADVYGVIVIGRNCEHRASCIMCGRQDDRTVEAHFLLYILRKITDYGSRHGYRTEHLRVISQHIDQLVIPVIGLRTDQLPGRSLCILVHLHACKQEVKIVRDHQDRLRLFQIFRMGLFHRHELIDRIEDLLLDAGPRIQIILRDHFIDFLIHSLCAAVTVSDRIAQDMVILIEQHVIHAPGINSHRYRDLADLFTLLQSVFDLGDQAVHIPAKRTVLIVHSVRETVHFLELHLAVLHAGEHVASAGCADINGQIIFLHL